MKNIAVFERLAEVNELRRSDRWPRLTAIEQETIETERDQLKLAAFGEPVDPELLNDLQQKRSRIVSRFDAVRKY